MAGNGNDSINVVNTLFLVLTPIASVVGLWWHATQFGVTWVEPFLFVIWYFACGLSITVGYHRLFSHRSHEASWPLRLFYALFG
ncbi:MAG: acyl-CoA desaturase, partial [Candidatus Thermoplasmatota archaeon]|nr:acyl-CoA desaturase [Candidatus Thermoplasmatota archaeon]